MYYLTTCYMQEKTSEGETIEIQSIACLFTNSPRWPFQCFKKILFTFFFFILLKCVLENTPKILYIYSDLMIQT